jgi:hypothetical protein
LLVTDGQTVTAGEVLALGESLNGLRQPLDRGDWATVQRFPIGAYNQLGELQIDFQTFH